jgi:hypothetical protein
MLCIAVKVKPCFRGIYTSVLLLSNSKQTTNQHEANTVVVYCENHTEHTDTVRTSQETHYISTTEPNRLMLFKETVAVL